jgi:hypothetical protein
MVQNGDCGLVRESGRPGLLCGEGWRRKQKLRKARALESSLIRTFAFASKRVQRPVGGPSRLAFEGHPSKATAASYVQELLRSESAVPPGPSASTTPRLGRHDEPELIACWRLPWGNHLSSRTSRGRRRRCFVTRVLFPYARACEGFLDPSGRAAGDPGQPRAPVSRNTRRNERAGQLPPPWPGNSPTKGFDSGVAYVHWLMDRDRKSTALKSLQGRIWDEGLPGRPSPRAGLRRRAARLGALAGPGT